MPRLSGIVRRLRGQPLAEMRAELDEVRSVVMDMNHVVVQTHEMLERLNHDVRSGAEPTLPLFLGHAERLRLDADVAVGAAQVIERQLAILEGQVAALDRSRDVDA